ncbi:MAG: PQQ-binding-like beta-propeller repeat protein [Acidimicrobiia bacterium]
MRRQTRFVGLLGFIVLTAAACDWTMVGFGPGRTGFSGSEKTITPSNVGSLVEQWTATAGNQVSGPVVGDGRVFVTTQADRTGVPAALMAFDAAGSGCPGSQPRICPAAWRKTFPTPANALNPMNIASPVFAAGKVWSGGASLHALISVEDFGSGNWNYHVGGAFEPATGATAPGPVVATEAAPAAVVDGIAYGYYSYATFCICDRPATQSHTSLIGTRLDGTGSVFGLPLFSQGASAPTLAGGRVYLMSGNALDVWDAGSPPDCTITQISARCFPLWSGQLAGEAGWDDMPAVANGLVYVPELSGDVEVFQAAGCGAKTCTPSWTADAGSAHVVPVAVTDAALFVSSDDGHLYAFKANGCGAATCSPVWSASLPSGAHVPSVAGSVVFVGANDGTLAAFNAAGCGKTTCNPLWSTNVGATIRNAPVISAGRVFVTDDAGAIHAFGLA